MNILTNRCSARGALALAVGTVLVLGACGSDDDSDAGTGAEIVTIADPWSRQPVDGQSTSAVYGMFSNEGDGTVTVVAATSPVSDTVELHEVLMNDEGQMSMQERPGGFEIPAGGEITLEPGGFHIMMLDIDPAEYPTDEVPITLEFDDGSTLEFAAEVREVEAMEMDHGDMEMDDGSMDEMNDDMEMDDG